MAKTLEKLAEEAMSLPTESRARLADLLVESLDAFHEHGLSELRHNLVREQADILQRHLVRHAAEVEGAVSATRSGFPASTKPAPVASASLSSHCGHRLQFVREHDAVAERQQHVFYAGIVVDAAI
jgi:hypothetical protein